MLIWKKRTQRIVGLAKPARGPSLAVKPGRAVHLAWTTGEDRAAGIHVANSTDGGRSRVWLIRAQIARAGEDRDGK